MESFLAVISDRLESHCYLECFMHKGSAKKVSRVVVLAVWQHNL